MKLRKVNISTAIFSLSQLSEHHSTAVYIIGVLMHAHVCLCARVCVDPSTPASRIIFLTAVRTGERLNFARELVRSECLRDRSQNGTTRHGPPSLSACLQLAQLFPKNKQVPIYPVALRGANSATT